MRPGARVSWGKLVNQQQAKYRTRREIEAFFEELGESSVCLALHSRMRFPMPFGEYHAAMWLARRKRARREEQALRMERSLRQATASAVALERGSRFAAGAALVALIALAFSSTRS